MTPCDGFQSESYDLYALGLLEEDQADQIRLHLKSQCETCSRGLRSSLCLWSTFGYMHAEQSPVQPRRGLGGTVSAAFAPKGRFMWALWGTAAALIVTAGLAWYLGAAAKSRGSLSTLLDKDREIHRLQAELDGVQRGFAARQQIAPPKVEVTPPARNAENGESRAAVRRLESDLQKANAALTAGESALRKSQARAQQLEAELRNLSAQVAAVQKEKADLETRVTSVSAENIRLRDAERQATQLRSRVEELQQQQIRLENVIRDQEQRIGRSLQLARMVSSPGLQLVRLRATESAPKAQAHALLAQGSSVVFYASNLPNLPRGRIYQLWVLRATNPSIVSGGIFNSGNPQTTAVEFSDQTLTSNITGLAVTDEPSGGSVLPTGHKFLIGTPRS